VIPEEEFEELDELEALALGLAALDVAGVLAGVAAAVFDEVGEVVEVSVVLEVFSELALAWWDSPPRPTCRPTAMTATEPAPTMNAAA
jgi:hypothetical protein